MLYQINLQELTIYAGRIKHNFHIVCKGSAAFLCFRDAKCFRHPNHQEPKEWWYTSKTLTSSHRRL